MFNRSNPPEELRVIRDPIMQEWLEFRCRTQTNAFAELNRYAKSLKPNVMIQTNIHGISLNNRAWANGIEHAQICNAEYLDAWGGEEPTDAIFLDGKVVSKIRNFKVARTLGNSSYNRGGVLRMAVSMAFNHQKMIPDYGYVGVPSPRRRFAGDADPEQEKYREFFLGRIDDYQETVNIADVAVLRGHASLAYNNYSPHVSVALAEQALIQAKIPFDIIFDKNLKDLSKYKVLLLANQESLTEEQVEIIRNFVSKGGGLVMTGATSLYDGWRRQRDDFALNDLFGNRLRRPPRYSIFDPDVIPPGRPVMVNYGRGRAAYLPQIIPADPITFESLDWAIQLNPPRNWPEITEAIEWTGRGLSLKVHAPLTVVAEYLQKPSTGQLMLHLVNFDRENTIHGIPVELVPPEGKRIKAIRLHTPDGPSDISLVFDAKRDRCEFIVPELSTYSLILIETG
jgi:hypothetical protein